MSPAKKARPPALTGIELAVRILRNSKVTADLFLPVERGHQMLAGPMARGEVQYVQPGVYRVVA